MAKRFVVETTTSDLSGSFDKGQTRIFSSCSSKFFASLYRRGVSLKSETDRKKFITAMRETQKDWLVSISTPHPLILHHVTITCIRSACRRKWPLRGWDSWKSWGEFVPPLNCFLCRLYYFLLEFISSLLLGKPRVVALRDKAMFDNSRGKEGICLVLSSLVLLQTCVWESGVLGSQVFDMDVSVWTNENMRNASLTGVAVWFQKTISGGFCIRRFLPGWGPEDVWRW